MASFLKHFASRYGTVAGSYTDEEIARAAQLVDERFSTPEWTHRVP